MRKLIILFSLFLLSCKSSNSPNVESTSDALSTGLYCLEIEDQSDYEDSLHFSPAFITHKKVKENCLCLKYEYSGCAEGEVLMTIRNTPLQNSGPQHSHVSLWVRRAGQCDQILKDSACFSLKRIYLQGDQVLLHYNNNGGEIMINAPHDQY